MTVKTGESYGPGTAVGALPTVQFPIPRATLSREYHSSLSQMGRWGLRKSK